jgi:hypothetical protein
VSPPAAEVPGSFLVQQAAPTASTVPHRTTWSCKTEPRGLRDRTGVRRTSDPKPRAQPAPGRAMQGRVASATPTSSRARATLNSAAANHFASRGPDRDRVSDAAGRRRCRLRCSRAGSTAEASAVGQSGSLSMDQNAPGCETAMGEGSQCAGDSMSRTGPSRDRGRGEPLRPRSWHVRSHDRALYGGPRTLPS